MLTPVFINKEVAKTGGGRAWITIIYLTDWLMD